MVLGRCSRTAAHHGLNAKVVNIVADFRSKPCRLFIWEKKLIATKFLKNGGLCQITITNVILLFFFISYGVCIETAHYYQYSDAELSSALCVISFDSWVDNIADCQSDSNSDYLHFTLLAIDSYIGKIRKSQNISFGCIKKVAIVHFVHAIRKVLE